MRGNKEIFTKLEDIGEMLDVKSVQETIDIIKEHFSNYNSKNKSVKIEDAIGRTIAIDIKAPEDIPGFNRSSVDGYACVSSDTFGASEALPAQLKLVGEVKMGEKPSMKLSKGEAVYVPTGGELPENADTMVMIEYTENLNDGFIYINKAGAPGNHVIFRGDDVKAGAMVIKAGTNLRPQEIGALAALGIESVQVREKLRVGIISTGDEIISIDEEPKGAQVRDINSYMLHAGVLRLGALPKQYGIVSDDFESIKAVTERALEESDIVLISGGSSVGMKDETSKVIDSLGTPGVIVHGIAVKPGKPTILGRVSNKAVVGLPGHPASAFTVFNIIVSYLIRTMSGAEDEYIPVIKAEISCNYPSNTGREEYLPVSLRRVDGKVYADPVFGKSGLITLLTCASGYVHIKRGSEGIDKGSLVEVISF